MVCAPLQKPQTQTKHGTSPIAHPPFLQDLQSLLCAIVFAPPPQVVKGRLDMRITNADLITFLHAYLHLHFVLLLQFHTLTATFNSACVIHALLGLVKLILILIILIFVEII